MLALSPRDWEYVMEEKGHFLFQRTSGVHHPIQPLADMESHRFARVVPVYVGLVQFLKAFWVYEVFDNIFVCLFLSQRVEFCRRRPKPCPPHQVCYKRSIRFHNLPSFTVWTAWRRPATSNL